MTGFITLVPWILVTVPSRLHGQWESGCPVEVGVERMETIVASEKLGIFRLLLGSQQ